MRRKLVVPKAVGAAVAVCGFCVLAIKALGVHWPERLADLERLGVSGGLLMIVAGAALYMRCRQYIDGLSTSRAANLLSWLLVLYPIASQLQTALGLELGLDFSGVERATTSNPHPGRLSPNGSAAYASIGMALLLMTRDKQGARRIWSDVFLVLASAIAGIAMAGYLLGLEQLYRVATYNRMLMPTAVTVVLICGAMWLLRDSLIETTVAEPRKLERRIGYWAVAMLTLCALASGLAGFSVLRSSYEASVMSDARAAARIHGLSLANTLKTTLWFPSMIATRPIVVNAFVRLRNNQDDPQIRALLPSLSGSFLTAGVVGVRFVNEDGRVWIQAGSFPGEASQVVDTLAGTPGVQAELRWDASYVLRVTTPVLHEGERVGTIVTEQRLPLFDEVLAALRQGDDSADALLCSRRKDVATCAPTRLYSKPFTIPMFDASGKPTLPICRALLGEAGALYANDLRGVPVVAGYTPVGDFGLGLVVKTDVNALYAPVRDQLQLLVLLVGALVAAGTWILRSRARPLLQAVVLEQQRTKAILDASTDAFVAADDKGLVCDWNAAATELFGWTEKEAKGRAVVGLILTAPVDHDHTVQGFDGVLGQAPRVGLSARKEILARHRDGREIPVEVSLSVIESPHGLAVNAFFRDIRESLENRRILEASERRLHDVLANVPAMVGHFDREERCLFANEMALKVHRLGRDEAIGRRLADGITAHAYEIHQPHIKAVLEGKRAQFSGDGMLNGRPVYYQVNLVPEWDASGKVVGFFLMTFDITPLKEAQQALEASQARLQAIADNLPVMISYIDRERRLQFVNKTFEEWTGIPIAMATGKPLVEVIGTKLFAQRQEALDKALRGERVEFELESEAMGVSRVLHTVYVPDLASVDHARGVYTLTADVTSLRDAERRMAELARQDSLTGLPNRRRFEEYLPEALLRAKRQQTALALLFADVDRFKAINDTHGHAVGDLALIEFAKRCRESLRSTDFVGRLAGDEFVVVLEGLRTAEEANLVAEKLVQAIRTPLLLPGGIALGLSTSIGVAYLPHGVDTDPHALLALADKALYQTKAQGRDGHTGVRVQEELFR